MNDADAQQVWNSLEIAKIIIGALTPIVLAIAGWYINFHLRRLDNLRWSNQKLVEKLIVIYDEISPMLNDLYCFYLWRGHWKDISPEDVVNTKRKLDKSIHIYKAMLGEEFYALYRDYIKSLFVEFTGAGEDAKIKSAIRSAEGDRRVHCNYQWDDNWNDLVIYGDIYNVDEPGSDLGKIEDRNKELREELDDISYKYSLLEEEFSKKIGIVGAK